VTAWLDPSVPRVGLGCMRLSTEASRDEARGLATIHAALDAGVRLLDTARAYGLSDRDLGHNERLVARALASHPAGPQVRIVTKGGMRRPDGGWRTDGRPRTLLGDARASADALGRPPDVWLLHAPDPRTPLESSLRALREILDAGLARAVGLSNVNRTQLQAALEVLPVAAVEVALSPFDDTALRGGVVELCTARGITLLAHSPLGGPGRAARLARDPVFASLAARRGISAAQVVLAWLLDLAPEVVALPGPRSPENARSAVAAAAVSLTPEERARLAVRLPAGSRAQARPAVPRAAAAEGEVVLVMGIPGAGKTRATSAWTSRGFLRLNRDERGGTLRDLARALDHALSRGERRVVLDNTYGTRASRADVLEVAARHGLAVRGLWLDTPVPQAQVNLCARLIDHFGHLPGPDEIRASRLPGVMGPMPLLRHAREVELPATDEGFAEIEVIPFVRAPDLEARPGFVFPLDDARTKRPDGPVLALGWRPGAGADDERAEAARLGVDVALCPHPGGPPVCWCRPPLPGAVVAWARRRGVDLARITVVGDTPTFRTLARAFATAS
jgi:aryl-alcohol dehydrogenase-like predicted oxidoreductase